MRRQPPGYGIAVWNRQRRRRVDLAGLRRFACLARDRVAAVPARAVLPEEIGVTLVSDTRIRQVHREFMAFDGPTDVITFQHGDLVISVDTAERQAVQYGTSFEHELRLYLVHGLLHLAGYDDRTEAGFSEMAGLQDRLVAELEAAG